MKYLPNDHSITRYKSKNNIYWGEYYS